MSPELIRTSPLTQREWQVLGLIYSGYSKRQLIQLNTLPEMEQHRAQRILREINQPSPA